MERYGFMRRMDFEAELDTYHARRNVYPAFNKHDILTAMQ